jgi:hypothetical protein
MGDHTGELLAQVTLNLVESALLLANGVGRVLANDTINGLIFLLAMARAGGRGDAESDE